MVDRGAILDDDQARAVCTDACYSSLRKVRSGIETACDNDKDVVFYDNTAYPGLTTMSSLDGADRQQQPSWGTNFSLLTIPRVSGTSQYGRKSGIRTFRLRLL